MMFSRTMQKKEHQRENGSIRYFVVMSLACIVLVGCKPSGQSDNRPEPEQGQNQPTLNSSSDNAPIMPVRSDVTTEQWTNTVRQVFDKVSIEKLHDKKNPAYVEDNGKADENGVTDFFACFDKAPPKCELSASGKRDGFRKN